MPALTVEVSEEVAQALARQARALLLSRGAYVRAVLAAVAAPAERERLDREVERPQRRLSSGHDGEGTLLSDRGDP